jgi:anti-anti-sigma factor
VHGNDHEDGDLVTPSEHDPERSSDGDEPLLSLATIETSSYDDITVVTVTGEIDASNSCHLAAALEQAAATAPRIVADLSRAVFVSASVVRLLEHASYELDQHGGTLVLVCHRGDVTSRLLGALGLGARWLVRRSLDEALRTQTCLDQR